MNLEQKRLLTTLICTVIPIACFPILFPSLRLIFFAPFIVVFYYKKSYEFCLWSSFLCGLAVDTLSSTMRLGLYAIDYCLTTALLYNQRRHFFADSITTLPIMVFFFSIISTLLQLLLIDIFEKGINVSWSWIATDLIYMPAIDALYAFVFFVLPSLLFGKRSRDGKDYFSEGLS